MPSTLKEAGSFVRRHPNGFIVGAILLVALALRLYNVNWDDGHLFHPDERFILMTTSGLQIAWPLNLSQLLSPQSPLNPHSFNYGSLPFYLLRFAAFVLVALG